jgi:aminopeptidase N
MDWWNELWLNEGFATWVGWLAIDHLYPGMMTHQHLQYLY